MATLATRSLTLNAALAARVDTIAAEVKRPPDAIIAEAITSYVDRVEDGIRFNRDAVEAWEDYQRTGLHLTYEEVDAWMAKLEAGENAPMPECHV